MADCGTWNRAACWLACELFRLFFKNLEKLLSMFRQPAQARQRRAVREKAYPVVHDKKGALFSFSSAARQAEQTDFGLGAIFQGFQEHDASEARPYPRRLFKKPRLTEREPETNP